MAGRCAGPHSRLGSQGGNRRETRGNSSEDFAAREPPAHARPRSARYEPSGGVRVRGLAGEAPRVRSPRRGDFRLPQAAKASAPSARGFAGDLGGGRGVLTRRWWTWRVVSFGELVDLAGGFAREVVDLAGGFVTVAGNMERRSSAWTRVFSRLSRLPKCGAKYTVTNYIVSKGNGCLKENRLTVRKRQLNLSKKMRLKPQSGVRWSRGRRQGDCRPPLGIGASCRAAPLFHSGCSAGIAG